MEDEKLIECVREERLLYDSSHPLYFDSQQKVRTWQHIGVILKQDPNKCKLRWESLRNQFRKYIRSRRTVTGQSPSAWRHYDDMSFLTRYMKDKTRNTFVEIENEGQAALLEEDNMAIGEEHPLESSNETTHSSIAIPMRKSSNSKRRGYHAVESTSAVLMKYLLEKEKNEKEKDDIDLFFDAMKATVKKFSAGNKLLAKQKVFAVISELEEINLSQQCDQCAHFLSVANVHQHSKPTFSQRTDNS
ncbi:transcription factor Adf-1-like [Diabrotica virgifera virgifera]|uniref:Transcription factor Adf-1-like n=1 Tax=Diabrotica virgifera virgifera TaxID=50390 RepID=A0A6P7GAV7_DIAVI|nr:transcription factor Adf-1-like [Diabrotica virgifera virgifera]